MKTLLYITFTILAITSFGQKVLRKPVKVMPQLSIYDIHGNTTTLKALSNNKVTFIDFWFIPCGPCFLEMNMLHKLYAEYKDNPSVTFLTITFSDASLVRPLVENRNTSDNKTYNYFKSLAQLDTFRLPVYFLKDNSLQAKSFIEARTYPENIFGFSGYPTIFIFDKKGNMIYTKTAFTKVGEKQQKRNIDTFINSKL